MKYNCTDEQLINYINNSTSLANVLNLMRLDESGGNYRTLKKRIKNLGIDISHFTGQSWKKNKIFGNKYPIEDYLCGIRQIKSNDLKYRLIKEGFFEHKCSKCNLKEWMGKQIPVQLDHIDGNPENNNLDNLRILCPNCHAQTDTYCGKNIKSYRKKIEKKCSCGNNCDFRSNRCKKCAAIYRNRLTSKRPSKETLITNLIENNFNILKISRLYNVSDNSIRNWCTFYNISYHKNDLVAE